MISGYNTFRRKPENNFLLSASILSSVNMGLQDFIGRYFFVIAESVGGFEFVSSSDGFGNAGVGSFGEGLEDFCESFVEPFVAEVSGDEFFLVPGYGHRLPFQKNVGCLGRTDD
jgi:hypothetical protein